MKINFTEQTVSIAAVLTFEQAAMQQELLQMAALEAVEAGDAVKTAVTCELAECLGIDLDIERLTQPDDDEGLDSSGKLAHGLPGGGPD